MCHPRICSLCVARLTFPSALQNLMKSATSASTVLDPASGSSPMRVEAPKRLRAVLRLSSRNWRLMKREYQVR